MKTVLELNLVENALDFVLSAARYARSTAVHDPKYAILHLSAGIELLVKARLGNEHWSLLFADVDKATERDLKLGKIRSVDFGTACKRLERIVDLKLADDELRHLNELRRIRNQVQHFAFKIDIGLVRSLVAKGHNFVLDFVRDNLADEARTNHEKINAIRRELQELESFIDERLAALQPRLTAAGRLRECPNCWQETLVVDNGEPICLFCERDLDWKTLAERMSETGEVAVCPKCGECGCTLVAFNIDDAGWYCVACETRGDYCRCSKCEDSLVNDDAGLCSNCWDDVMSRNE